MWAGQWKLGFSRKRTGPGGDGRSQVHYATHIPLEVRVRGSTLAHFKCQRTNGTQRTPGIVLLPIQVPKWKFAPGVVTSERCFALHSTRARHLRSFRYFPWGPPLKDLLAIPSKGTLRRPTCVVPV